MSERTIFMTALDFDDPAERWAYLDDSCRGSPDLRRRVEALIHSHEQAVSFLNSPPPGIEATEIGPVSEVPGDTIGPYKLLQQIGEGGMGVVFMAEQTEPIQRTVALKIIKPGMDTRQVIARFEAERQALALMDHPNIAKVLDAGTTESARPYFVMDLVKGVPITQYCDEKHLSLRERLELFKAVCEAVQHAHQKGIIHRDLKPTNVLVAEYDNHAVPKVIDFGVAKATGQQLTERTMFTEFGQVIGTVEYIDPEQAKLNQLDIDTRSDIYSLGVLLYELLTGSTPFEQKRLREAAFDEVLRIIREEEPPKPSTRLSDLGRSGSPSRISRSGEPSPTAESPARLAGPTSLASIAANRHTEPARLTKEVRGELDWIVMKSLDKERNRRYETAAGLARDIERYLHDEPVQACPPSASYRFRKFARRNKTLLAAGGAIAAALLVGLGLSTWQYFRATTESARAKAVSDLLQEMLGSADAARGKGVDYKVRELLDDFAGGLGGQLADQPEVEADIHATIGRAYRSVKRPDQAQPHFERAIELRRRSDGPQSEDLAAVMVDGAWNLLDQQRHAKAESQANDAVKIYRARGITGAPLFHALEILQHILISAKRDEDAERVTQEALDVARQNGQEFPDQANLLHRYADMKTRQGKVTDAEQFARQAVDMHRRLHGDRHPETAWGLKTLARALVPQQKLAEAEKSVREALKIFRRQFPDDHDNVRDTMYQLKAVLEARGDKPAVEALAKEEAVYAMRSGTPDYHIRLGELLTRQSITVRNPEDAQRLSMDAAARSEEAHRQFREAIEAYDRMAMERPDDLDRRYRALDGSILALKTCAAAPGFGGEVDELNRRLDAELPKFVAAFPDSSQCQWYTATLYNSWGRVLFVYSDYLSTVEHAFSHAIDIYKTLSLSDPDRPYVWIWLASANTRLGDVRLRLGRLNDAEAQFRTSMDIYDQHAAKIAADIAADPFPQINLEITHSQLLYAYLLVLVTTHREQEAAEFVRKAALSAKQLTEPVDLSNALWLIALVQLRLGDEAAYRATCKAMADLPIDTFDELTKRRQILIWCLAPTALDDLSLPVKRAEELAASNLLGQAHIPPFNLGMALYRDGQYDRAAAELAKSIEAYPKHPLPGYDIINHQRLWLAMARWKQGQRDEARRLLGEALPAVDEEIQNPRTWLHYRAYAEILRREATDLIKSKEADEAVENKTP